MDKDTHDASTKVIERALQALVAHHGSHLRHGSLEGDQKLLKFGTRQGQARGFIRLFKIDQGLFSPF